MFVYIVIYFIKFAALLAPFEYIINNYRNVYLIPIIKIIYNILLLRQTINLGITDIIYRTICPFKPSIYFNLTKAQPITYYLKLRYYISYILMFIIINYIIYTYDNIIVKIYFKGYIHGHLYYIINYGLYNESIIIYKPYYIILGIIDYLLQIKTNYNSLNIFWDYFIQYIIDMGHLKYAHLVLFDINPTFIINLPIKIIWYLCNYIKFLKKKTNSIAVKTWSLYLFIKKMPYLYKLLLRSLLLWNEYYNIGNLLSKSLLKTQLRIYFNEILQILNDIIWHFNKKPIKLALKIYSFPFLSSISKYFINDNYNLIKDSNIVKRIIVNIRNDIYNALLNNNGIFSAQSRNLLTKGRRINYTYIDDYFNLNTNTLVETNT